MTIASDLEWFAVALVPFCASVVALLVTVLLKSKLSAAPKGTGGAEFGNHMNQLSKEIQEGAT